VEGVARSPGLLVMGLVHELGPKLFQVAGDGDGEKRTIERDCTECGKIIEITVYEDDTYEGGHYFDEFTVSSEDSDREYKQTGEREGHNVVKWTGDEEPYEDWECDDCDCSPDQ
jgi:hypothetical protein